MVTFVYAKRRIPPLFVVVMAFIMSSFGITQNATAQSLACNNKIQLSLGSNCCDTIQPSLFLTTPVAAADSAKYWIEVKIRVVLPSTQERFEVSVTHWQ